MFRHGVGALAVCFCRGVKVHMITKQIAERDGIGVIVMRAGLFLMRVAGIERRTFVHVGFAIPITRAVAALSGTGPYETVARIKHRHAIHEITDCAEAGEIRGGVDGWIARDTVEDVLIFGQIRKRAVLPRPHGVLAESGSFQVKPVRRRVNSLHASIGG